MYGENDLPVRVFDMVSSSLFVLLADADDKALIVLVIITVTFEAPSLPLPKLNTPESAWKTIKKTKNKFDFCKTCKQNIIHDICFQFQFT